MTLSEEIEAARALCISAHAGQFRRDGVTPYHTHPMAVADAVPDELKPAALLHDVIEDTSIDPDRVYEDFPARTSNAVFSLTRYPFVETYDAYIESLMHNPDAVKIKIADMEHNMSCQPSEHSKQKIAKWLPVLKRKDEEYAKTN